MSGFDEVFDFVVVGSGGGSMCAGLVLRDAGKSVVVLEKTPLVGGTTARSGGVMWIPNNRFMARDGVVDSPQNARTYLDNVIGDDPTAKGTTAERRDVYIREAPRMIDFLVDHGIKLTRVAYYPDYYDHLPGGVEEGRTVVAELFNINELGPWRDVLRPGMLQPLPVMLEEAFEVSTFKQSWKGKRHLFKVALRAVTAKLTGKRWATAGQALQGRMLQAALKAGIEIRPNSPVAELMFENGAAIGVQTVKDGKPWRIRANLGVLVNAGGFARNQRMRDQYIPHTKTEWSSTPEGDTGEMIEEMARHGAALSQMEEFVGNQICIPPGDDAKMVRAGMQRAIASPHAILVDRAGKRYMSEGGSYMAFCKGMLEHDNGNPSWMVFDDRVLKDYMFADTLPIGNKPRSWVDEGFLKSAATIEELALKLAIAPSALRGTVDRFNGFVAANRDEDFGRGDRAYDHWLGDKYHSPSATLGAIDHGPFHAVAIYPGDVGTYGGVVTDHHACVLREDGTVIAGLYATGVSTASVMGRAYPGAGASVGPSFTWGFVAAHHALAANS